MRNINFIFLLLLGTLASAQINFDKGYIINNNDEKLEVLIRNNDWLYCNLPLVRNI